MRGYSDEMGGPDSVASPSEWGPLSFGDEGMTAAGLPAGPGVPFRLPDVGLPKPGTASLVVGQPEGPPVVLYEPSDQHEAMRRGWLIPSASTSPSDEQLRHNHLLRREIMDPGYGASRGFDWRESALRALGVPYVNPAPPPGHVFVRVPYLPGSRKPPFGG